LLHFYNSEMTLYPNSNNQMSFCSDVNQDTFHLFNGNIDVDSYYCGKNVWYNICDSQNQAECLEREHAYSGAGEAMNGKLQIVKMTG